MGMRKGLIILGDLLDQDLVWLSQSGDLQTLTTNQRLIAAGQDITHLFIVTEGRLSVRIADAEIAEVGVGDILGEMSFVEKRPPVASVIAMDPCRVLAVPRDRLLEQFQRDPAFAARFYRALAVFLSDRLRSVSTEADRNELDEGLLDTIHVAGDRMLRLIELLEGQLQPG